MSEVPFDDEGGGGGGGPVGDYTREIRTVPAGQRGQAGGGATTVPGGQVPQFGPRMAVVAPPPAASGLFQPPSIIAPVRVLGAIDPAAQRAIAEGLAQEINRFFQQAQVQHQLAERGFTHMRQTVGDAVLRFIANGNQSFVEVSPAAEALEPEDSVGNVTLDIVDPPDLVEVWAARYERVEWASTQDSIRVINILQNTPPQWFINEGEARRASIAARTNLIFGPARRTFVAYATVPSPSIPGWWRHVYAVFYWPVGQFGFPSREEAEAFDPRLLPFIVGRNVTGLWGLVSSAFFPAPTPFVPYPAPALIDVYISSRRLTRLGPLLAADAPDLRPIVPQLNLIETIQTFPPPPLP